MSRGWREYFDFQFSYKERALLVSVGGSSLLVSIRLSCASCVQLVRGLGAENRKV
jgi:hypothetical protein